MGLSRKLRYDYNNLYVVIAVEKATGPPLWGVHKITSKIYNCCFYIFNKILCFQYFLNFKYVLYIQYNNYIYNTTIIQHHWYINYKFVDDHKC